MASVISNFNAAVVVMHMKGTPKTMQKNPNYFDLIKEIKSFFSKQIEFAIKNGINRKNIILDPGIGFGKGLNDNFEIIGKLDQICDMGYPVLVGPSRKSFIGEVLNLSVNERLEGSLAAANACLMNGAKMIRVHDVNETKKSLSIIEKIIAGEHQISVAYAEPNIGYNFFDCLTSLSTGGDKLLLNGTKSLVLNGGNADQSEAEIAEQVFHCLYYYLSNKKAA